MDSDSVCPYLLDHGEIDVSNVSADYKMWFAAEVNTKKSSVGKLARKYNIKYRTVYEWARRARMGKTLQVGAGRPRVLDLPSRKSMCKFVVVGSEKSFVDIRGKLEDELNDSIRRRWNYVPPSEETN